jgi:hypothetical protein
MTDTLHSVLRSIRGETKSRPNHLTVFREFLAHLERINRAGAKRAPAKPRGKTNGARRGKG